MQELFDLAKAVAAEFGWPVTLAALLLLAFYREVVFWGRDVRRMQAAHEAQVKELKEAREHDREFAAQALLDSQTESRHWEDIVWEMLKTARERYRRESETKAG